MAHWALIDENNVVTNVIVTSNDLEDEGQSFVKKLSDGEWIKTSVNTFNGVHYTKELDENGQRIPSNDQGKALRKNFAGIGMIYNKELDEFEYSPEQLKYFVTGGPEANVPGSE